MLINEHDKTKEMIAKFRNGLLTEQPTEETPIEDTETEELAVDEPTQTDTGDIVTIEGDELEEEMQKFKDGVTKRVSDRDFEPLKIYKP